LLDWEGGKKNQSGNLLKLGTDVRCGWLRRRYDLTRQKNGKSRSPHTSTNGCICFS